MPIPAQLGGCSGEDPAHLNSDSAQVDRQEIGSMFVQSLIAATVLVAAIAPQGLSSTGLAGRDDHGLGIVRGIGHDSALLHTAFLVPAVPSWACGPANDGQDSEAVEVDGQVHRWICKHWAGSWQWVEVDRH